MIGLSEMPFSDELRNISELATDLQYPSGFLAIFWGDSSWNKRFGPQPK
jgi:hypothetical protein